MEVDLKPTLSPKEFAETIDASESTIKRWVDKGRVRADKTEGGHRRITVEEAIRVIRENQLVVQRGDLLGMSDIDSVINENRKFDNDSDHLYAYLYEGDGVKTRGFFLYRFLQGQSIAEICDGPMRESMERLGELWKSQNEGIYIEHRATNLCIQALQSCQLYFHTTSDSPVALGGSIGGDFYTLPSLAATAVLVSEGFRAINLGPNTPFDAFYVAVSKHKPLLVWLSMSICNNVNAFVSELEDFIKKIEPFGTHVIIGGKSRRHARQVSHPNLLIGSSMSELSGLAKGLLLKQQTINES